MTPVQRPCPYTSIRAGGCAGSWKRQPARFRAALPPGSKRSARRWPGPGRAQRGGERWPRTATMAARPPRVKLTGRTLGSQAARSCSSRSSWLRWPSMDSVFTSVVNRRASRRTTLPGGNRWCDPPIPRRIHWQAGMNSAHGSCVGDTKELAARKVCELIRMARVGHSSGRVPYPKRLANGV